MTQIFDQRQFPPFYDHGGHVYADLEFRRCRFSSSAISITERPAFRTTVRDVKIIDCEVLGCAIDTAIVEDVVVENLKTNGLFQTWGAVFKHVTIKGKIGRIMLSPAIATGTATPEEQQAFDQANAAYYAGVDWALDISEGEFMECDIRGVPAHLIRRDSGSQVVVKRAKALEGRWRNLDLSKTAWATAIEFLLDRKEEEEVVLVAPKRHRNYDELLHGLNLLRDAGVAERE